MSNPTLEASRDSACMICGEQGSTIYEGLEDKLFGVQGHWSVIRCENADCGLAWLSPKPSGTAIKMLYENYYTHGREARIAAVPKISNVRHSSSFIARLPRNIFGITGEREKAELMYLGDRPPGRLLDVGCGDGGRLAKFAAKGWHVHGIDIDEVAIQHARIATGLDFTIGSIETSELPCSEYDAVIMNHVLEHLERPQESLEAARRLVAPGGCLVVRVPNFDSRGRDFFGKYWRGVEVPRHFFHFSTASLNKLAAMVHMENAKIFTVNASAEVMFTSSFMLRFGIPMDDPNRLGKVPRMLSLFWQLISGLDLLLHPNKGEECVLIWRAP